MEVQEEQEAQAVQEVQEVEEVQEEQELMRCRMWREVYSLVSRLAPAPTGGRRWLHRQVKSVEYFFLLPRMMQLWAKLKLNALN